VLAAERMFDSFFSLHTLIVVAQTLRVSARSFEPGSKLHF